MSLSHFVPFVISTNPLKQPYAYWAKGFLFGNKIESNL